MLELAASRSRNPEAVVVEARMVKGQGPVATVIAKRGTLRPGQPVVVGCEWGKVRRTDRSERHRSSVLTPSRASWQRPCAADGRLVPQSDSAPIHGREATVAARLPRLPHM